MRARRDDTEVERTTRRHHAAAAHVLRERRHRQLLRDLRLADERPAAAPLDEQAIADEIVERCPDGKPRHPEVAAELPLRGDRVTDSESLDQVEDAFARLALLGADRAHRAPRGRPREPVRRAVIAEILAEPAYWSIPLVRYASCPRRHRADWRPSPGRRNGTAPDRLRASARSP